MEGRCQTCKWADARVFRKGSPKWREELSLVCSYDNGAFFSDVEHGLLVTPQHGCVQWEKRDEA